MPDTQHIPSALADLMSFVDFINLFRSVKRTIWYKGVAEAERNGEHSFQVAMVAWFMNEHFLLGFNVNKLIKYALVHDLPEVWAGDTPNYPDPRQGKQLTLFDKQEREALARDRIIAEWGQKCPEIVTALLAYDKQGDSESRFICCMEKLLASINILQDDGRTWQKCNVEIEEYLSFQRPRCTKDYFIRELWKELELLLRRNAHLFKR